MRAKTAVLLLIFASVAVAQFRPPQNPRPVTSLPVTCSIGQTVFLTTGTVGIRACTATNTWTSFMLADSLGNLTLLGSLYTAAEFNNGTCTTAKTINPANGNRQKVTLTNGQTCALTFTQPSSGTVSIQLKVIQSSVSTFNGLISGCKWPGGVVPAITATSAAVDLVTAYLDGTNAYCVTTGNFQ